MVLEGCASCIRRRGTCSAMTPFTVQPVWSEFVCVEVFCALYGI